MCRRTSKGEVLSFDPAVQRKNQNSSACFLSTSLSTGSAPEIPLFVHRLTPFRHVAKPPLTCSEKAVRRAGDAGVQAAASHDSTCFHGVSRALECGTKGHMDQRALPVVGITGLTGRERLSSHDAASL